MAESMHEKIVQPIGHTPISEKIKRQTEEVIECILDEGITSSNIEYLYKLVDIHKDIENEQYWKEKIEMNYRGYGNYGREEYGEGSYGRRRRDSRGRYMEGGYGRESYGRENYGERYRGEDKLDEMYQSYGEYYDNRDLYHNSGNYGAKEESLKSLEYMLQSVQDFMKMLKKDAKSQEEVQLIKKSAKEISEM